MRQLYVVKGFVHYRLAVIVGPDSLAGIRQTCALAGAESVNFYRKVIETGVEIPSLFYPFPNGYSPVL